MDMLIESTSKALIKLGKAYKDNLIGIYLIPDIIKKG